MIQVNDYPMQPALGGMNYRPTLPRTYRPKIGLIGCGNIAEQHLTACRKDGLEVVALCDLDQARAAAYQKEFFPEAELYSDYNEMLAHAPISVADIALHPGHRTAAIEAALKAGKHVLSQKPFSLDLSEARRLVELADARDCRLAVNQNGRWAPYVRSLMLAIEAGYIGEVQSVNVSINWDHTWVKGLPFERIHNLVLYDFAIHWIDMVSECFNGREALEAYAAATPAPGQDVDPPLLAHMAFLFENGTATMNFNGNSRIGARETIRVVGSKGVLTASGEPMKCDDVCLETEEGTTRLQFEGDWYPDGFRGTMGELLCAIEEGRQPSNSGKNNLRTLELAFAAINAADHHRVCRPGEETVLGSTCEVRP